MVLDIKHYKFDSCHHGSKRLSGRTENFRKQLYEVSQKLIRGSIILNNVGRATENTTPGLEVTSE